MNEKISRNRPNFLVIMSDEHGPMFSSAYGHPIVKSPNMDRLVDEGATFDAAYCNSPLCVPSRLSFMTGKYVSKCRGWDNASPLPVDALTWPYLLRSVGYDAVLSGKMHLVGTDRLHGFSEQLAFDPHAGGEENAEMENRLSLSSGGRHPISLWKDGMAKASEPWDSVTEAGPGTSSMIDADDEIEEAALKYLREPMRKDRPFALCVGFVAPHFPFVVPQRYFSKYYPEKIDLPNNPSGHLETLPPAGRRLRRTFGFGDYTQDQVLRARAAYYGLVTYLDEKIGRLLDALETQGLADNTVVIYTSDHGESLGEHGLWRKMNFYEQSARVPLQIAWPGVVSGGQRFQQAVSLVDLTATILDICGVSTNEELDGCSLLPMILKEAVPCRDEAFVEMLAHGTDRPRAMLRKGKWKLNYSHGNPPEFELYDLEQDPGEFNNLAHASESMEIQELMFARILQIWGDPDRLDSKIRNSQESRLLIRQVMGDASPF